MISKKDLENSAVCDSGLTDVSIKGNPTVLIADDEEIMREVTSLIIEENGGNVLLASNGKKAVDIFTEKQEEIDYIILDYNMPVMNGYEALVAIREIKPSIGIIMVSGLKLPPEVQELRKNEEIEFLTKPFFEVEVVKLICRLQQKDGIS